MYSNMAQFSTEELKVIKAYPLKTALDSFRAEFASRRLADKAVDVAEAVEQVASEASDRGTGTIHG